MGTLAARMRCVIVRIAESSPPGVSRTTTRTVAPSRSARSIARTRYCAVIGSTVPLRRATYGAPAAAPVGTGAAAARRNSSAAKTVRNFRLIGPRVPPADPRGIPTREHFGYVSSHRARPARLARPGDEPPLDRPDRDLRAGREAELAEDVADVPVGGRLGDHELLGDLAVGPPARDQGGDLPLAPGQRVAGLDGDRRGGRPDGSPNPQVEPVARGDLDDVAGRHVLRLG